MREALPPLICALTGAGIGSFLPMVAYRLSVPGGTPARTACGHCAWAFPRGLAGWVRPGYRCPACRQRLGPVATATACAAGAAALAASAAVTTAHPARTRIEAALLLGVLLVVGLMGVLLAAVDIAVLRLPDLLLLPTVGAVVALFGAAVAVTADPVPMFRAVSAAALLGAVYALLALLPGNALGFGDVKLAALLGAPLGWLGWSTVLRGAVLPVVLGGLGALALLATGRIRRSAPIPFGPALVGGFLLAIALP